MASTQLSPNHEKSFETLRIDARISQTDPLPEPAAASAARVNSSLREELEDDVQNAGPRQNHHRLPSRGHAKAQTQLMNTQLSNYGSGNQILMAGGQLNMVVAHQSVFASLIPQHSADFIKSVRATRAKLAKKTRLQSGRRPPQASNKRSYFDPYVEVEDENTKRKLLKIAKLFQFLDCAFADYFKWVVPALDRDYAEEKLQAVRQDITKRQNRTANEPDSVYLGDLGHFCEEIALTWNNEDCERPASPPIFNIITRRDQEAFQYLQDALEVPYWELMLDLFVICQFNQRSYTVDAIIRVLRSIALEVRQNLIADLGSKSGEDEKKMGPIIEGINARLEVIDSVWNTEESRLCEIADMFRVPQSHSPQSAAVEKRPVIETSETSTSKNETVILMAMILFFLIAAILPGYKAFSISMKNNETGSVEDADFWFLIQSSIMSVLGSLVMVLPLLKKSWFCPAYTTMWIFFFSGVVFAVLSIAIYPRYNTGWSSVLSFFGSVASIFSVLAMTQATAREAFDSKVKKD